MKTRCKVTFYESKNAAKRRFMQSVTLFPKVTDPLTEISLRDHLDCKL